MYIIVAYKLHKVNIMEIASTHLKFWVCDSEFIKILASATVTP